MVTVAAVATASAAALPSNAALPSKIAGGLGSAVPASRKFIRAPPKSSSNKAGHKSKPRGRPKCKLTKLQAVKAAGAVEGAGCKILCQMAAPSVTAVALAAVVMAHGVEHGAQTQALFPHI